ncbi:uncharacterized protein [Henckelia pumila]|uniref:uncharacterized protein n=1 Tax=Henckelia pumila TaxID=405737 RepID=UPI003C6E83B4
MEVLLERFQTYHLPTMKGTEDVIACGSWFEELDQLFESLEYSDERRIRLIVYQLQDLAKICWIVTKKFLENRGIVVTWQVFRIEFYQRLLPASHREDREAEIANLKQGNLNIEEYIAGFSNLVWYVPRVADNAEAQVEQFINGLNPNIYAWMNAGRPNTFAEAMDRSKRAEAGFMRQKETLYRPQYLIQQQPQP